MSSHHQVPSRTMSPRSRHSVRTRGSHDYDAYATGRNDNLELVDQEVIDDVIGPGQIMPGTVDGDMLIPGSLDITPFASTIRPVILVTTLPTLPDALYPIGQFVYKTNDVPPRLYKNVADVWIAAIGPNDIQADSITAGQIAAGAISTSELAANAVTVGKFAEATGSNFAPNSSFEQVNGVVVDTYGVPIFGWDTDPTLGTPGSAGSPNIRFRSTNAKWGSQSLELKHVASTAARKEVESILIPVIAGRRIGLKGWVRGNAGNNAAAIVGLGIREYSGAGARLAASTLSGVTVGASTTYASLIYGTSGQGYLLTNTATQYVTIRLTLESGGSVGDTAFWDGIEVYYMDDDIVHASGNVQIDSTGVTINNGKLTFKDNYGATAMDGAGFGGTWQRFLANGFYNGDFFAKAATLATELNDTTNPLPWWNYARLSGTRIIATSETDSATASTGKVRFQMLNAGAAADDTYIQQVIPVNGSRGQSYVYTVTATYASISGTALAGGQSIYIRTQHLKADGVTTTGAASTTLRACDDHDGLVQDLDNVFASLVPADAYYVQVRVGFRRSSAGTTLTSIMDLFEVKVTRGPSLVLIADADGVQKPSTMRLNSDGLTITPHTLYGGVGTLILNSTSSDLADGTVDALGLMRGSLPWHRATGINNYTPTPIYPHSQQQPYAYPVGFTPMVASDSTAGFAVVAAGLAGAVFIPFVLHSSMKLWNVQIRQGAAASLRTAEFRLYYNSTGNILTPIAGTNGTFSFTPAAADDRSANTATTVDLAPGVYWLCIRNTSAAQTFPLRRKTLTELSGRMTISMSLPALGADVDVSGSGTSDFVYSARLNGMTEGGEAFV